MRTYRSLALGTAGVIVGLLGLVGCADTPTSPLTPGELRKEEIQGAPCAPDGITSYNGQLTCRNGHWGSGG